MRQFLFFTFLCFGSFFYARFDQCHDQLHLEAKKFIKAQSISGGAIAIVDGGGKKIDYVLLGEHSFRRPISVNPYSEFRIGEVTQSVTGMLLAIFLRDGLLQLDDPIEKFFPRHTKIPQKNGQKILIRHLATHTSGLPNLPIEVFYMTPSSTRDILRSIDKIELSFQPGEKYQYSRLGFALLGHILTRVSKQSLPILLKKTLTDPLNLEDTVFHYRENLERLMCGHKNGREIAAKSYDVHSLGFQSSCGLYSSAHDLAQMMQFYLLSDEPAASKVRQVILSSKHKDADGNVCAIGWKISSEFKEPLYESMSQSFGHSSYIGFIPEKKIGIVILMNNQDVSLKPLAIRFLNLLTHK